MGVYRKLLPLAAAVGGAIAVSRALQKRPPSLLGHPRPPGRRKRLTTRLLEAGAALLQRSPPLRHFHIYLVGFHPDRDRPDHQWEAHHYCRQVNEDFAECVLFDGAGPHANLVGIEYIISEALFDELPPEERRFWHPHNGEILSGQLTAPGLPASAERALMARKLNGYGKTWHLWDTGAPGEFGDRLPLGEPRLAWSFVRDGELLEELAETRDRLMGTSIARQRRQRARLQARAHPQAGVDALRGRYPRATTPIPGVRDREAGP